MEMPTGKTIQTLRRQKGLTQEQLAEAVGVTAAAVSKWETASAYPDILLLCPLARALGTTPDILLDFRPLLSEALHFSTAAPNVTGHGWLYPTGYPVYAPARSPVEGI